MFKTPKFWLKRGFWSYLLLPFSLIYLLFFYILKYLAKRTKINKPVICVGNIIAGGSGKTPSAIAIGDILQKLDANFIYLSRGYKRQNKFDEIILKKQQSYDVNLCGDEPALLSEYGDVIISNDKLKALKNIDKTNYDLVVLDDGIQNNFIFSDLRIIVIDAKIGFGNNFLLPSGPLRENIKSGLKKADLILVIGKADDNLLAKIDNAKLIRSEIKVTNLEKFNSKKLIAFCGLAFPDKFFNLAKKNNLNLVEEITFVDHHNYTKAQLQKLCKKAQDNNCDLITTKKDWVKFPREFQDKIGFLDIKLEFIDGDKIKKEIEKLL